MGNALGTWLLFQEIQSCSISFPTTQSFQTFLSFTALTHPKAKHEFCDCISYNQKPINITGRLKNLHKYNL